VVGISQRRTRVGARFQCAIYSYWDPSLLAPLLGLEEPAARAVDAAAMGIGVPSDEVVSVFLSQLPT
jgi:hypothetical protein